jgi:hypothetical protein
MTLDFPICSNDFSYLVGHFYCHVWLLEGKTSQKTTIIPFCAQPIGSFEKPPYIALSNPRGVAAHHEVCGAEKIWWCAKIDENCGIPLVKCSIYVNYPDFLDNEGPEIGESMFANIHSLCALGHEFCRALKHRCEINHDGNMTEIHEDEMGMDQNLLCHILELIEYHIHTLKLNKLAPLCTVCLKCVVF